MDKLNNILYSQTAWLMTILFSNTCYAGSSDTPIPEPGAGILLLLGSGLMVIALYKKRKDK